MEWFLVEFTDGRVTRVEAENKEDVKTRLAQWYTRKYIDTIKKILRER